MAFIKHGKFVVGASTIPFFTIPFTGDIDLHNEYDPTKQSGTNGEFLRELGKDGRQVVLSVTGNGDAYDLLLAVEKSEGTLTIREKSYTLTLMKVEKIGGLEATPTVVAGFITGVTYTYMQCRCTFFREK